MSLSAEGLSVIRTRSLRVNYTLLWTLLSVAGAVLLAIAVRLHVEHRQPARDEVERVVSPDGRMDAVLYESSGNATESFDYQVVVVSHGQSQTVAEIFGATRNDRSYGVDLQWINKDELNVDYLSAQNQELLASSVSVGGHQVHVSLHSGIRDQDAPTGGMLFNLKERNEPPA
jgi:hypothetical protein